MYFIFINFKYQLYKINQHIMYCPNCGTKNGNEYKFCPNCGFEIGKIQLKKDNELNQIKVSSKIVDFPSEVWNKLVIKKEDFDLFIEKGLHAESICDEDEQKMVDVQEIIDIQNKLILSQDDIDLLISSVNSEYNYTDDKDDEYRTFYFGQIKNGQNEGFVCQITGIKDDESNEMKYVISFSGYWVNDKREGFGIEIYENYLTPRYVGEWKNGSKNGNGIEFYSKKGKYFGEWKDGSYNGFGIKYYDNGEKQEEGYYRDGQLNGQGSSYFYEPVGVIRLQGLFENGELINGIEFNTDGLKVYEGIFKDGNIFNGISYDDGVKVYEGEFKFDEETYEEGIWHGKGKLTLDDGTLYEGDFVDWKLIKGKLTLDDGTVYEGDFVESKLNGKGKKTFPSGTLFEGNFINGELNGKGKKTFPSGWCFEGDFVNDLQEGKGQSKHTNGEIYIGNYLNGIPTGDFEYININGESVLGYFKCTRVGNDQNNEFYAYDLKTNMSKSNDNQSPIPPKDGAGLR